MHTGFSISLALKCVHTYFISLQFELYYIVRHLIHVASVYMHTSYCCYLNYIEIVIINIFINNQQ
jgi:hypothetical protein